VKSEASRVRRLVFWLILSALLICVHFGFYHPALSIGPEGYYIITDPPGALCSVQVASLEAGGISKRPLGLTPGPLQLGGLKGLGYLLELEDYQTLRLDHGHEFAKGNRFPSQGALNLKPKFWWSAGWHSLKTNPLVCLAALALVLGGTLELVPLLRQLRELRRAQNLFRAGQVIDGCQIERYKVINLLGEGGMAQVFRAENQDSGQIVALKILKLSTLEMEDRSRFASEIRLLRSLSHPNLIAYLDHGIHLGVPFFAMELMDGSPLDELRLEDQQTKGDRLRVWLNRILQLTQALEYLAHHQLVHRDLKPSNIFVKSSKPEKLVVMDLGIAKHSSHHSTSQNLIGTAGYMSPEQLQGAALDWRSDLYSLGIVGIYLWTGQPAFGKGHPLEIIARQVDQPQPPIDPNWPEPVRQLLSKWTAAKAAERASDASAVRHQVEEMLRNFSVAAATE
jgi:tRNA A-37 threonylcarbamoyl transferase component Bud32